MRAAIRWAIKNTPAMNTLLIAVLIVGVGSWFRLRREEFPRFELEIILVQVPYPGASPDEVESGICQKIEESVRSIEGIKKVTSVAVEGMGNVIIELESDVPNAQKVLNKVESEVDRIPSFPALSEKPEIQQLTIRRPTIKVGVIAEGNQAADAELQLRDVVEKVRDDLLLIPEVSVADIQGERSYQIDVEISKTKLREHGLTLSDVAREVRRRNLELPGGEIKDDSQVFRLRGKNKRLRGKEIERIPIVTNPRGVALTLKDIGTVRDEFEDVTSISRINGKPGMGISIEAAAREDVLAMTAAVKKYARDKKLPPGYQLVVWDDRSINVHDRLDLLKRNGLQGLILVFIVLALFLQLRLSFWVALGIPVSVLGACVVLWQTGSTMNMLSMFAFLIALGIVVDDGIVIGENIYAHREQGKGFVQAAVDGVLEVIPSVTTSVATTIIAFVPMFFVSGVMGKFFAVLPLAVIAMLTISLLEATFVLPCHLAHDPNRRTWLTRLLHGPFLFLWYPFRQLGRAVAWVNGKVSRATEFLIERTYMPTLRFCLKFPAIAITTAVAVLIFSLGLIRNGTVPWVIFPKLDARQIQSTVVFPDGTPSHVTEAALDKIETAIRDINDDYERAHGKPLVKLTHQLVGQVRTQSPGGAAQTTEGSHAGVVSVELVDNTERELNSQKVIELWRRKVGDVAGVETMTFKAVSMGPGGQPVEFKLLAPVDKMPELEAAVESVKTQLRKRDGVFDVSDDSRPGKWELQLTPKENARSLGVPFETVTAAARAAYYGEEAMRLQRGRHEVKVMVRNPESERRSLAQFSELRVDVGGSKVPITELADIRFERGYSEINRIDQMRSITITADLDESKANARAIVQDLKANVMPGVLKNHPDVRVRWEGQQEQTRESIQSLMVGLLIALLAMFVLLTLEFTSYAQPAIIMAVIPFAAVGALWGHAVMGLPLTLFSVLGLVALTGVVVNDSIVLVDFINARVKEGVPLRQALVESGRRRFRPVILTSLTTVAGLLPILLETSMQAQLLIPMANSLCFGLMTSTLLVLVLVPVFYLLYGKVRGLDTGPPATAERKDEAAEPIFDEPAQERESALA